MYISQPPQPKAHTQTHKQILMARLYTRLTTTHAQPCAHIDTHVHALSFFLFFFFKSPPLYLCQMHPQNTLSHLGGKAAEGASLRYDSAHGQRKYISAEKCAFGKICWAMYADFMVTCEVFSKLQSLSCPNQSKFMVKEAPLQFVNEGGLPRGQRGFAVGSG